MEFVHNGPQKGQGLADSLNELGAHLSQYQPEQVTSVRTSVHVHIDTSDMDEAQKRNFLMLCVVFEPALYAMSGEKRRSNPYCQSLTCLSNLIRRACIEQCNTIEDISYSWEKYTSVNLTRYPDLGTFEFRMLEGTPDINRIATFAGVCTKIKHAATRIEGVDTVDMFSLAEGVFDHVDEPYKLNLDLDSDIAQGIAALRRIIKGRGSNAITAGYSPVESVDVDPARMADLGLTGITSLPRAVADQLLGA